MRENGRGTMGTETVLGGIGGIWDRKTFQGERNSGNREGHI